jgi:hypothetical protein
MSGGFCECYVADGLPKYSTRRSWVCTFVSETSAGLIRTIHCRSCLRTWTTKAYYGTEVHEAEQLTVTETGHREGR